MSHTNQYDSICKSENTKNTNDDDECKEYTFEHQDGNKSVDNPETLDILRN